MIGKVVNKQLNLFGMVLIIDCHSYPSNSLKRDLDKNPKRPDFNIGTDSFNTPKYLIGKIKATLLRYIIHYILPNKKINYYI